MFHRDSLYFMLFSLKDVLDDVPMPSKTLTIAAAKAIKAGTKPLAGGRTGLWLYPHPSRDGYGKWVFRFVSPVSGKRRDMGIGPFPEVGIADARDATEVARRLLRQGTDPIDEKAARGARGKEQRNKLTFEMAAEARFKAREKEFKNLKHRDQWINTLRTYAFPIIGSKKLNTLTTNDFGLVLEPIWLKKPETAKRVKQRCFDVMEYAQGNGYVDRNVVSAVTKLLPNQPKSRSHFPAMAWREVPAFLKQVVRTEEDTTRTVLEFLILTAARSGEVRGATWSEINFETKVWTIPKNRMKAGVQHEVPLSDRALELLKKQVGIHDQIVFPSVRGKILSDMFLTQFLRRHEAKSGDPDRFAVAHGFRSSFRDFCSEHGYSRDVAERALAHAIKDKVESAYHRTNLLEERRPMMQKWADFLSKSEKN